MIYKFIFFINKEKCFICFKCNKWGYRELLDCLEKCLNLEYVYKEKIKFFNFKLVKI